MSELIDGETIAREAAAQVAAAAGRLRDDGVTPGLAVVLPTAGEANARPVRAVQQAAEEAGVRCTVHELSGPRSDEIEDQLAALSVATMVLLRQTVAAAGGTVE